MNSNKVKAITIVFVLLFAVSFVAVGCKQKPKSTWVNTNSMPGNTFANHNNKGERSNSAIVYLGNEKKNTSSDGFGPNDVSFEFQNLK